MPENEPDTGGSLWGGRFASQVHPLLQRLSWAGTRDAPLYAFDIAGSIAHAQMLARTGILAQADAERIRCHLEAIKADIAAGKIDLSDKEDIHMAIEEELTRRDEDGGTKLHAARSRNDQIALDERLWLKESAPHLRGATGRLQGVLLQKAEAHQHTIIPGLTHMQYAQPVALAHHLLAYFWMLARDDERLQDCAGRANKSPLGAGALAGTSLPIDRAYSATLLGFSAVTENSLDSVSDRDYLIEFLSALSITMMHLSRFAEDLIYWYSPGCRYLELDDAFATGSSLMPQKKNADVLELIRGKAASTFGALSALLSVMKGLPLAYNRDMQEDKSHLFQAAADTQASLEVLAGLLQTCTFQEGRMEEAAAQGFFAATDLAEYLVERGVPFRQAHASVGAMVRWCLEHECGFAELQLADFQRFHPAFGGDVFARLDLRACVDNKESAGGTGKRALQEQLRQARRHLEVRQ